MLLRFNISNFLSFDSEQEFSMLAGKVQKFDDRIIKANNNLNILKFCAMYGANASGKSNLIKAVDIAQNIIINGIDGLEQNNLYCKFKKENKDNPSKFEFEIMINDTCYAYGFTANLSTFTILGEWLYELSPQGESMIFQRDMVNNVFESDIIFEEESNKSKFSVYSEDIMNMNNILFLSELNRKNILHPDFEVFNNVFDWFSDKLKIIYPNTFLGNSFRAFNNDNDISIIKLLDYFDTGITGYKVENSSLEELRKYMELDAYEHFLKFIKKSSESKHEFKAHGILRTSIHLFELHHSNIELKINKLLFKHGASDLMFEFGEESDGTRRLIELLDVIHNDNNGMTFLIDELDRSLHPQMTKKFVETFLKVTKNKNTQLFITTHESNLLDLQLLRRDEIWFVERDKNYTSTLKSLDNFKVRYDKKIEKDYLEGRYGAVPLFKDFSSYIGDTYEQN